MENNNEKRIKLTWNRKVVSISFLALALFMLLAVSYAYFTATVTGNDTAKKTTVTTGSMSLKLTGPTELKPTYMVPGDSVSITFNVENTGNVPATYNLDMIDVKNNFNPASDLVYTVTSTNNGGKKSETTAPTKKETLIRNILIQPGTANKQEYTLTIIFKETHSNQNSNQGKTFEGKVQINNLEDNSIATTILRNTPIQDSKGIDFSKGSPMSDGTDNGNGLFTAPDDDGTSYYFRGDKDKLNNNVTFANMKWKIIRINGDGSIRLIFNDTNGPSASAFGGFGNGENYLAYTRSESHKCTQENPCISDYDGENFTSESRDQYTEDSIIKPVLESWYKENLDTQNEKIALTRYCNDTSYVSETAYRNNYGPYQRIFTDHNPILTCPNPLYTNGGVYKLKIGLITADEMNMAGISSESNSKTSEANYLYRSNKWWSMSPGYFNEYSRVLLSNLGYVSEDYSLEEYDVVPVINLKPDVTFTGDGTTSNPYTIE